jgi:enterochelin esterase-like enzyme
MTLTRRQCLALAALASLSIARRARAELPQLAARELGLPDAGRFGKRCLVLRPTRVAPSAPLPLLLLFHGLGETESEALGIHAWQERYGLPEAYARLTAPPVARTLPNKRYLSDDRLAAINAELARTPLPDVNVVCAFTPNPFKVNPSAPLLDGYAAYLEHVLLPAARAALPTLPGPEHWGVDGVSLGGYISLEIFLRKPELFGVVGTMQGAFGKPMAEIYARRMAEAVARVGSRSIHVTTTSFDPFRDASLLLAQRLGDRGLDAKLTLAEGPHDQTFLREAGSLEMLLFQTRALSRA